MKRRGKSPPPDAQASGHEKPHAVQDKTGSVGRLPAARKRGTFWVLVAPALREERGGLLWQTERNDHHAVWVTEPRQNSAYRQPPRKALSARGAPSLMFFTCTLSKLGLTPSMTKNVQYWLVKQEPTAYSWSDFVRDGVTAWTGVRNFQARANLQAMRKGDLVLFYHSVVGKEVVGLAQVSAPAYADFTATDGDWSCVDVIPLRPLQRPVTLAEIKSNPALREIKLVKQSRLSVLPLTLEEYAEVMRISESSPSQVGE